MSSDSLCNCGCCGSDPGEASIWNRSGLAEIRTRIGTHGDFLARMLDRLPDIEVESGARPLRALTTRAPDDPSIALLDAWAAVGDVLTFYQERIANEGYLGTATERRSVLELARMIGYELDPGVAASTVLTFKVDDAPGAPTRSFVPAATRVQSIPGQGELPQTFETGSDLEARREWNALRLRSTQPQRLEIDGTQLRLVGLDGSRSEARQIFLQGSHTDLHRGDRLLIALEQSGSIRTLAPIIREVSYQPDSDRTRVVLAPTVSLPSLALPGPVLSTPVASAVPFTGATVASHVLAASWRERDLRTFLNVQRWSGRDLVRHISRSADPAATGVFALRQSVGIFGHNAQDFDSLPAAPVTHGDPYPHDWDTSSGFSVWRNPRSSATTPAYHAGADLYLERKVDGVLEGGWMLLEAPDASVTPYRIDKVSQRSVVGFGMSAKATALELSDLSGDPLGNNTTDKPDALTVRGTTAHLVSDALTLAPLPVTDDIESGERQLMLDGLVLDLDIGRTLVLSGERADAAGVIATEQMTVEEIIHQGGFTTLLLQRGLLHPYRRATVTISANAVAATHGETVVEVLGSGDGTRSNQRFTLRRPPLTWVASDEASGRASTLEVRVNGVLWHRAESLLDLGPRDRGYQLRIEDDGTSHVTFGDGVHGARLPTGVENVHARYRSGIGGAGEMDSGQLTLLQTRPLGIRSVTNPIPATGSDDPETLDDARDNAPRGVRTFQRVVSLRDYEDFARSFAGIGKASATTLWTGEDDLVHLTVASSVGSPVAEDSDLYGRLVAAIGTSADPIQRFVVGTYLPRQFNLTARLLVDPDRQFESVRDTVVTALLDHFRFEHRRFGQDVTAAEVLSVIHSVQGMVAVDLDALDLATAPSTSSEPLPRLSAESVRWTLTGAALAELLTINPAGITLQEMA